MGPLYSTDRTRRFKGDAKMKTLAGILPFTRSILEQVIQEGDTVVDATMGNGLDTLFLASRVGPTGAVLAYDVQEEAVTKTRQRLEEEGYLGQARLLLKGHETVAEELEQLDSPITAAMFNLGYRPGGDKDIVTEPTTTIQALYALRQSLKKNGVITLVIYPGHDEGKIEKEALLQEISSWDQNDYQILQYQFINQKNDPPFLVAILKK
jgi:cyclopropane fatty-acyl-phospholipid synthase-like methyltransferase